MDWEGETDMDWLTGVGMERLMLVEMEMVRSKE